MFRNGLIALSIALASGVVGSGALAVDDQQSVAVLTGGISYDQTDDVVHFQDTIQGDRQISCSAKTSLPRLYRVAGHDDMRKTVWKRMLRQELLLVSGKELTAIERHAAECNLPLQF